MQLSTEHLTFRYDRKRPIILNDVSLKLESGERVGIVGPSGCGKSTLAKLLAGYLQPDEGTVLLDGEPLPRKGFCPVQMIYQHPEMAVNPRMKMGKILTECWEPDPDLLDRMGIESSWFTRWPYELSGGELQRFCVARALMSGANFLICDEISTMLDVITQAQIWNVVLAEVEKQNMGVIAVTHNRHLARRIATRIYDLSKHDYV